MHNSISWNLQLNVKDGKLETAKALASEMIEAVKAESGTTLYEWFFSADGTSCHIREGYTDSGATLVHLGNFGANYAERFMACFEPTQFTVYGSPSDEVRGVLDGFGAAYLEYAGGFSR